MFKYDIEYGENLLRIHSKTAEEICRIRWEWIKTCRPVYVLDYGSGIGWFRAFRPSGVFVDTYDVMPVMQTGITGSCYDIVTFWDVIEHLPYLGCIKHIVDSARCVAATVPVMPEEMENNRELLEKWKHYKPDEHLRYFKQGEMESLFAEWGFYLVKKGQPECPPRKDIWSYLFKRPQ